MWDIIEYGVLIFAFGYFMHILLHNPSRDKESDKEDEK